MAENSEEKLDKHIDRLIKLEGRLNDRLSSERTNLEEAKSVTNSTFALKQAVAEAKQGQVQKAFETGEGSALGASIKGTAQGIGWGIKESLGGKRGQKMGKGAALGTAGSMLGTGALHAMGAMTGNPLFNMAGTALSNRRQKITGARREYLDSKAKSPNEGGTESSNEVVTKEKADVAEIENVKDNQEIESVQALNTEKIDEIAKNTAETNNLLSQMNIAEADQADASQEIVEDKKLANDDIKKAKNEDGEDVESAAAETPEKKKSLLSGGLKGLLGGGGGMMGGLMAAALPLLASGLAIAGTAAIGGFIGNKIGGMINDKLGLTGEELGNISEKIGLLPSADDIAKASVKAVQDIKDIGKLEKGSKERGDAITLKIDELEKRKQEALDEENSFWGRMKTGFNNLVIGEGVVPQESKNLQHEQDTYKRMLENNEAAKNGTPNAAPSGNNEAAKNGTPNAAPSGNKNAKLKTAKAINSSRSAKSMARKQQKDNVRSYIAEKYSDDGKISISQGAVMINDKYNEAATKEYHEKMYETGVTTKGQSANMYKLAQQKYNKEQNNTPPSGMNNNTKKSVSEAYESSPTAAQAKVDGVNSNKTVVVQAPPTPAQPPANNGGGSKELTTVSSSDGIDYGLSQYSAFPH